VVADADIRWKQRLSNLETAVALLREPLLRVDKLSMLEKEGTVQRFEVALELAWKTLKDYLEFEGQTLQPVTPRNVIKAAFAAAVLHDGQTWIDMLDHRNLLSHTYSQPVFDEAVRAIESRYMPAFTDLLTFFSTKKDAP
jgi:nucleotidyltransferase substrate binding protein (TIGR01987 family)